MGTKKDSGRKNIRSKVKKEKPKKKKVNRKNFQEFVEAREKATREREEGKSLAGVLFYRDDGNRNIKSKGDVDRSPVIKDKHNRGEG